MKTKEWIAVIIAIIVIAVIVSLVTVKMTGEVIKVNPVINGTTIYTKAEIDTKINLINSKLQTKTTNQGVLNMLSNCTLQKSGSYLQNMTSCAKLCNQVSKTCVTSLVSDVKTYNYSNYRDTISDQELAACNQQTVPGSYTIPPNGVGVVSLTCICCSV